jgi:transposase
MEQITRIFIDTSKQFFQLHGVNAAEEVVLRRKLKRDQFVAFFAKLPATLVGLEACGASHYWARELMAQGHAVKLVPAQYVKAYVKRGKNDARDAEAGCEAMSRPTMRFVPIKSAENQASLMVMSMRERLTRERTRLANTIRGHAAEFGLTAPKGVAHIAPLLAEAADAEGVPKLARQMFATLAREWDRLGVSRREADARLMAWHRTDALSRRLAQVPSLGPIGASMMVMKLPDPKAFKSARHFAAWIGLTPKDHSTAGKQRLGAITCAGDEALRSVLVVGATAVLKPIGKGGGLRSPWLLKLLEKDKPKLAAVALANRVARIAWKMMVTGEAYDPKRLMRELPTT